MTQIRLNANVNLIIR